MKNKLQPITGIVGLILILGIVGLRSTPAHAMQRGISLVPSFPLIYNLSYETYAKERRYSWAVSGGFLPQIGLTLSNTPIKVGLSNIDLRGRWHPFAGGFFLGLGFGWKNANGTGTTTIDVGGQQVPTEVGISLSNLYMLPHMGWIWNFGDFTFGLEFGMQSGLGGTPSTSVSITDPTYSALLAALQADADYLAYKAQIEQGFDSLGKLGLPYAGVRLGWTF
jgi:hypothetical protein